MITCISKSNDFRLPLYEEHSCALGNLTLHYLDELNKCEDPTAERNRSKIKEMGQKLWIIKSNFSESLEDAFRLWDAVSRSAYSPFLGASADKRPGV